MSEACCACINVKFQPTKHDDGSFSERWACTDCGMEFVKKVMAEARVKSVAEEMKEAACKTIDEIVDKYWPDNDEHQAPQSPPWAVTLAHDKISALNTKDIINKAGVKK